MYTSFEQHAIILRVFMKRFHKLIGIVLSLTMITLISGCGGSSSSTPVTSPPSSGSDSGSTGTLSLYITDAKPRLPEKPTAVNIRVIAIEYGHNDGWTEVEDFEPLSINLLDWQDGKKIHLGDFELPVGHYKEIRFKLDIPECNITFKTAPTVPLTVPSGDTSGYKGKGAFDITANAKIAVAADWDVGRALHVTGSGKYILHPVVQLFVIELSGGINGTVVDIAEYDQPEDDLVVYAYEDDSYTNDEQNIVDEVRFLNAVSSSDVNMSDGNFTFSFLEEGNYTLVTAYYISDEFQEVVDREDDIEVFKGEVTAPVDLNTSDN